MKNKLRSWARSVLNGLSTPQGICSEVVDDERFKSAKTIFTYVSCGNEPDTYGIIKKALELGNTVSVPRCVAKGIMEAVEITDISDLKPGKYQIPEPHDGKVIPFSEIDFAVIPCLCADRFGNRLGHGGGYYDRFLANFNGFSVILCRKELELTEIPLEEHDKPANAVIFT